MKNCSRYKKGLCKQINPQPLENFGKNKAHQKDGLQNWCKFCNEEYINIPNNKERLKKTSKKYHSKKENKSKINEWHKNYNKNPEVKLKRKEKSLIPENIKIAKENDLIKNYGITLEQYNKMLLGQNNCCEMCNITIFEYLEKQNNRIKSFCVDHNHETGQIRGLLCHSCNLLLGKIEKNKNMLNSIIYYIDKYNVSKK
jgi:hypothetical protein